ncbi:DUF3147 family protein [Exiguobacterium sp. s142]|uniref:DUF3147 family protein n=1 Tax=Exiguobacterium sp. s142 TaxID=2751222 RepID=UPI001BE7907F|nr:DUF3147 family protein [Exiguobacterium sp. s142]
MYILIKIISSALLITFVTELGRRYPTQGGIIAALPLISLLSIVWLTLQGQNTADVNRFTFGVLVGLPATIVMLSIIYLALHHSLHISLAITLGIVGWGACLAIQKFLVHLIVS